MAVVTVRVRRKGTGGKHLGSVVWSSVQAMDISPF